MGEFGPGGTGNDPAGGYSGGGGGYGGMGYDGGTPSAYSGLASALGYSGGTPSSESGGGKSGGTDFKKITQLASLGAGLFGAPGAIMGALIGWGMQQPAANTPQTKEAEASLNQQTGKGAGGSNNPKQSGATTKATETSQAAATDTASGATTGDTASTNIQNETAKAEETQRKRGYGYLEAIKGETDPNISALWNPNIYLTNRYTTLF